MKTFRKISFIFLLIISIFVISLFNNFDIQVYAAEETNSFDNDLLINPAEYSGYGCTDGKDLKEENIDYDQNTVIEDNSGFGCGSTCGASREDGYSTTYQNGCRNWQVMPIISPLYKYWIDESTLSDLTDYQKALFIKYVDEAAAEWNSVRIADYDGKIVKLEKQSSNGLNVVPVRYNPNLDSGIAGQFNPVPLLHEIEIKRYNDYDTIMHEFGHMIGLQDLDLNNSPGTHISLMGYASDDKLHYQDIQGLAVANGKHTKHDFQKYWYDGTWYNYVCFYCDATDSVLTNWGGGSHLEMANTCIHDYRDLVSAGDRHWQKCTKCYKVIECEFRVNVLNSGDIEITGLIDDRTTITIPREIGGQKVVAIKANAFANLSNLQTVNFHYNSNITLIGNSAFKGCSNLTSISFPNTVTNIDASAFENCSYLQSVKLPTNLVVIGSSAFKGCNSLESIVLQEDIQLIDDYAFENCSNLKTVIVEREVSNSINIGVDIFKGCSEELTITVPQGRIAEYKNEWIAYSNQIIPNDENYTQIDLSCHSIVEDVITLKGSHKAIYQLNIYCNKSYKITFNSDMDVEINLYDSNMHLISTDKNEISSYLGKGTYYIDIEILTNPITKVINAKFCLRWSNNVEGINCNQELDALLHLHQISADLYVNNLYFENSSGPGFYKFQLNGIFKDGSSINYKEGTISVYEDSERTSLLNKLPNYSFSAKSSENRNILFVYLPRNGKFYIQIITESNDYEYFDLLVTHAEEATIHLLPDMLSAYNEDLISNSILEENVLKLDIRQTSKYLMTLTSNGELNDDFTVLLLKPKYENNKHILENKEINYVSSSNLNISYEISLIAGTYFIYYYGNSNNLNITLNLNRLIVNNSSMSYVIQADPVGYNPGSEVKFNNGALNDYVITGGFTRNLYFINNAFSTSRLAYDWYSSNETIASVSSYGTVLANNVLSEQVITIYAVYRDNPSIVYYRTFTIVQDTSEEILEINLDVEYSYTDTNGIYQIQLNENNSPYPWFQYYGWTVYVPCQENEIICSINQWGEFSASGAGYATVTGVYLLNPRVRIVINFKILE